MKASVPPGTSQRRARARNATRLGPRHVAQPEAHEQGIGRRLRLGPRVADVEMGPQVVRDQALAGELERRLGRVVAPQLASRRGAATTSPCRWRARRSDPQTEARRASGRPCRGRTSRPCRRSGRAVAAAAEVPVVVLAGPGLVVGDHLRVEPGRRRGGSPAPPPAPPRPRSARTPARLPGARPVRPGRRAAGSAGTGSRPLGRGSRGRAGPSPRDRRARASRARPPHQRQVNDARNGTGRLRPGSAPAHRRGDVDEPVGIEDLGEQRDAVDDPRARAG